MKKKTTQQLGLAALSVDLKANVKPSGQIQLTPDGTFKALDGRPENLAGFFVNSEIADHLISHLNSRLNDILVDFEHQSLYAEKNGQPVPAAGWIDPKSFEYIPNEGITARVQWNEAAAEFIRKDEDRYLSPVLAYDQKTGAVRDIKSVALTNYPALDGMAQVAVEALRARLASESDFVNSQTKDPTQPTNNEEPVVNRDELIEALGLPANASDDQITEALTSIKQTNATIAALRAELELKDADDAVVAVAALKTKANEPKDAQPDPSKYVGIEVVEALKENIKTLQEGHSTNAADRLVTAALTNGQLLPPQETWAREFGKTNLEGLKNYLNQTPAIAALRGTQTQGKAPASAAPSAPTQSPDAIAVLKQLGVSEDDANKVATQESH